MRRRISNKVFCSFCFFCLFAIIMYAAVFVLRAPALLAAGPPAVVAVDPGHGGYDDGIVYNNRDGKQVKEKNVDLEIAKALISDLQAQGAVAFATRRVDEYMNISRRAQAAQAKSPNIFLSIHLSATGSFNIYVTNMPQAQGDPKQLYLYSKRQRPFIGKSRDLASALELSVKQAFPNVNVSYMELPLPLLDEMGAPAVLIECPGPAYLDYTDPSVSGRIAQAVAGAVMVFNAKP